MSGANSTGCATSSADGVAVIGRPAYTHRRAGRGRRGDAARHRQARTGGVSGRDVRRPLRRIRRLPGCATASSIGSIDTKLARSPKVTALVATGGLRRRADRFGRIGRAGGRAAAGRRFGRAVSGRRSDPGLPISARAACSDCWTSTTPRAPRCAGKTTASGRVFVVRCASSRCAPADDLLLVAGMRVSQRDKLIDAGIATVADLAGTLRAGSRPGAQRAGQADRPGQTASRPTRYRRSAVPDREPAAAGPVARARTPAICSSTSRAIRCGPPTATTGAWNTCSGFWKPGTGSFARCGRITGWTSARR